MVSIKNEKTRIINGKEILIVTETMYGETYTTHWKHIFFKNDWSSIAITETYYPHCSAIDSHHVMIDRNEITRDDIKWGH